MNRPVVHVVWAAFLLGCASPTAPNGAVHVETLAAAFDRAADGSAAAVAFAVTNTGTRPVLLATCGERLMAAVDRWEGVRWVQHSGDACLTILPMDPLELLPGARRNGVRMLAEPGRYRLRVDLVSTAREATVWSAATGPFDVR